MPETDRKSGLPPRPFDAAAAAKLSDDDKLKLTKKQLVEVVNYNGARIERILKVRRGAIAAAEAERDELHATLTRLVGVFAFHGTGDPITRDQVMVFKDVPALLARTGRNPWVKQ